MTDDKTEKRLRYVNRYLKKRPARLKQLVEFIKKKTQKKTAPSKKDTGATDAKKAGYYGLSIVMPCYNEGAEFMKTIRSLYMQIPNLEQIYHFVQIIVVDDGSKTAAKEILLGVKAQANDFGLKIHEYSGINYIAHPYNQGKGAAIRSGVKESVGQEVWLMDADGACPLESFLACSNKMHEMKCAAVVGNRRHKSSKVTNYPFTRKIASKLFNYQVRRRFELDIEDTQCPCKVLNGTVARKVFPKMLSDGFTFDVELLARLKKYGFIVLESPVTFNHDKKSTVKVLSTGSKMLEELKKLEKTLQGK